MLHGRRARGLAYTVLGLAAVAASVWTLRRITFGTADPLSAGIGVVSLLVGVAALVLARRDSQRQQTDTTVLAEQLAVAVQAKEQRARRQLLGEPGRAIDVRFDFRPAPAHDADGSSRTGRLSEVADYYRRLQPARMVITGAGGAGKTVLAVELMMMLLENRAPEDPVPVRLSASSWDLSADIAVEPGAGEQLMLQWLAAQLADTYRMTPRSARALVDAGRVLPVIDGLDELDATDKPGYTSRAGQALRVFNAYQHYRDKAPLIVTCRRSHYEALTTDNSWVEGAARVEIRPVDAMQARRFIDSRAVDIGRWRSVLDAIQRDRNGPLADGLATPWRLTLATIVYEQRNSAGGFLRDPHELTSPALDTPDKVRDHLLELFIPAALNSTPGHSYDPARAHRWLATLARYLRNNTATGRSLGGRALSGTDIVLHELWPLAGNRRPRTVILAMLAAAFLSSVLIMLTEVHPSSTTRRLYGAAGFVVATSVAACWSWSTLWPPAHRVNLTRLRTPQGRRQAKVGLVAGLVSGLASGLVGWLVSGPTSAVTSALTGGLAVGLVVGLTAAFTEEAEIGAPDPRSIVRDDLMAGLVLGLSGGFFAGPVGGLRIGLRIGLSGGLMYGLTVGLTAVLMLGLVTGLAGGRYAAFLLCTRRRWSEHWLPWRLGRFLDLCYQAGLIRIAGAGYQFRHRELQDYLAEHPAIL